LRLLARDAGEEIAHRGAATIELVEEGAHVPSHGVKGWVVVDRTLPIAKD
jgi:hypothetical protein